MTDLAIVVVGYDRPRALSRLLYSLNRVQFDGDRVALIISLDRSGNDTVAQVAKEFSWNHGEKTVRTFPQRLGLKDHVLACGELTREYGHLIVLEDDLYVSQNLYRYATQAIDFYRDDDRVAGIALYSHLWNIGCHRPFMPLDDSFDAYLMQYACSWGQIWSREKWGRFREWYREHADGNSNAVVPEYVAQWSERSWLKHHIRYCIETGRFFAYPKIGVTTNFSDAGEHNLGSENGYQIPIQEPYSKVYRFPSLYESRAVYDAFFESLTIGDVLGIEANELCADLYGMKRNREGKRYWLTLQADDYKVLKSFDLALRPHEANILHGVPGDAIKLYDTSTRSKSKVRNGRDTEYALVKYDVRNVSYKTLMRYSVRTLLRRLKVKLRGKA